MLEILHETENEADRVVNLAINQARVLIIINCIKLYKKRVFR